MKELIEDLIKKGMGNFMDRSRDALAWTDEIYLNGIKDENELAQRYENLDLTKGQGKVINDYMACASTVNHRYADISFVLATFHFYKLYASGKAGFCKTVDSYFNSRARFSMRTTILQIVFFFFKCQVFSLLTSAFFQLKPLHWQHSFLKV